VRFLLDVSAGMAVADQLDSTGHDVLRAGDVDPRMSDDAMLDWAVRERRVLVTTDLDFEEMIWTQARPHCGLLRLENLPRAQRVQLLETTLAQYAADLDAGAIVIATRRHVRVRRR